MICNVGKSHQPQKVTSTPNSHINPKKSKSQKRGSSVKVPVLDRGMVEYEEYEEYGNINIWLTR